MQDFQQRVVDEQVELSSKIARLTLFKSGDVYAKLPFAEQERLTRQLFHMGNYNQVLVERIQAF